MSWRDTEDLRLAVECKAHGTAAQNMPGGSRAAAARCRQLLGPFKRTSNSGNSAVAVFCCCNDIGCTGWSAAQPE